MTQSTIWARRPGAPLFTPQTATDDLVLADSGALAGGHSIPPVFYSDWATAAGSGDTALLDTGAPLHWSAGQNAYATDLAAISATSLGFPAQMQRVLEHTFNPATGTNFGRAAFLILPQGSFTTPAIGTTLYHRVYFRANYAALVGGGGDHHPLENEQGTSGSVLYNLHPGSDGNGSYPMQMWWDPEGKHWQLNSTSFRFTEGVVYRMEWSVKRETSATYTLAFRYYGADDSTLLYPFGDGNSKIVDQSGNIMNNLGTGFATGSAVILTGMRIGNNGWAVTVDGTQKDYFGGVCVRSDDWCGPYTTADK